MMEKILINLLGMSLLSLLLSSCTPPTPNTPSQPAFNTIYQQLMYEGCMYGAQKEFQEKLPAFSTFPKNLASQVCVCMVTNPAVNYRMSKYLDAKIAYTQNHNSTKLKNTFLSENKSLDWVAKNTLAQCMNSKPAK